MAVERAAPGRLKSTDTTARTLIAGRALRGFVDGSVAVLLPAYLLAFGHDSFAVGVLSTATLLGSALATLAVGAWGHRAAPRTLLLFAALLMAATGVGFASLSAFAPLLVVAFIGTLNPGAGDVSVFLPLEHARLASLARNSDERTALFARYSLVGSLSAAFGALAVGLPAWLAPRAGWAMVDALRAMFVLYAVIGFAIWTLYRRLPLPSAADPHAAAPAPLGPSRPVVVKLAALFSVDAFAGGLVLNSLLSLWLMQRFELSLAAAGTFFFWTGLLSAASQLAAPWLARRIGLLNTMVFTHIPANVCLVGRRVRAVAAAGAGAAAGARPAVADGRAHAHRLRDERGHAGRAHGCGQLHRRAAQPGLGREPDAGRRAVRRRLAGRAAGALRVAQDRLRRDAVARLPWAAAAGRLNVAAAATSRLFVALWPDAEALRTLAAWQSRWAWPQGAALVAPAQLHLTLHFIGATPDERLPELTRALALRCDASLRIHAQSRRGLAQRADRGVP